MLILVLGGARSGKSAVAEAIAQRMRQPVVYLATLVPHGDDRELLSRIAAHQRRRPFSWRTVDARADLAGQLRELTGTALVDSLGPWVAQRRPTRATVDALCGVLQARAGDTVVVSDEVGMSVHPTTTDGLSFRDELGAVNESVAQIADQTLFVVAGRVLSTTSLDADEIVRGGR